jgi:hypothetical protein
MWLKYDGFVDQVKTWWISYEFSGLSSYDSAKVESFEGGFEEIE